ncbi:V-type ATP synthase subunit E family protein [Candidatus Latescibacterota bacterium]
MPKIKLIDIIRANSDNIKREHLEKAQTEADAILDKASKYSENLKEQVRLRIRDEAESIMEKRFNVYRFQKNAKRYQVKSSSIERIWDEAGDIIEKITKTGIYKNILRLLFFECAERVPDGSLVRTSPEDAAVIGACIKESSRQFILEEDRFIWGGVEFVWPDRKIVIKNTLPYRLSKLKSEGNVDISKILFSSMGENES